MEINNELDSLKQHLVDTAPHHVPTLAKLLSRCETLERDLKENQSKSNSHIQDLKKRIEGLLDNEGIMKARITELENEIEMLQKKVEDLETLFRASQAKVRVFSPHFSQLTWYSDKNSLNLLRFYFVTLFRLWSGTSRRDT